MRAQMTSQWFKILVVSFALIGASGAARTETGIVEISVCGIDVANPPIYRLTMADTKETTEYKGVAYEMLNEIELQASIRIIFERRPWKRCLAQLQSGQSDAVIGSSYVQEREQFSHYPRKLNGSVDYSKLVYSNTLWIYTSDPAVQWDGVSLKLPPGAQAAAGLGYSSADLLQRMGVEVIERYEPKHLANLLASRRVAIVASYAMQVEPYLDLSDPNSPVRRLPTPLMQDDMFLVFSRPFYARHQHLAERIWEICEDLHESGRYDEILALYFSFLDSQ
ncbi:conserved hypothetical protein [Hahella chejuensis KCTC 2396]|uniref:Solute-binding protein family 3/N-terminal domain-containing protein n=1 Tax=Hahella chejuensis (strain KCTC 2396) TaxID=349521 RepID=Q2SKL2_HAHCH|nr:transporter substrate-binding domain-containing protein [Hahella chejuensis]ABC28812.1 conserved hypothetical protein [Hahella chejuensis KCTC 2396]